MLRSLLAFAFLFSTCTRTDPPPGPAAPAPIYRLVTDAGPPAAPASRSCEDDPCTFFTEGVVAFATDGTTLVLATGSGELLSLPARGGNGRTLALAQRSVRSIAIADGTVFFTREGTRSVDWTDGTVSSVPLAGGAVRDLVREQHQPTVLAVDRERIYWVNNGGTVAHRELRYAYRRGGPTTTMNREGSPHALLAFGGALFVADRAVLERYDPLAPEQHNQLVETELRLVRCALAPGVEELVCAVQGRGTGGLLRVPTGEGEPTVLAGGRWSPSSVAVDTNSVYFTDPNDGRIVRVPRVMGDGGAPSELVRRRILPDHLVLASGYAFWLEGTNGTTLVRQRIPQ